MAHRPILKLIEAVDQAQVFHAEAEGLLTSLCGTRPALIFMDPPFNMGVPYAGWDDDLEPDLYAARLELWIGIAAQVVADCGSIWLNLPDQWAAEAVIYAKNKGLKLENWCIWHYRFGMCQPKRFISSKTHVLWLSRGNPIVNHEAALVPSDRAAIYNDSRINDTERGGMRMDFDVWGFDPYWGRVQGNNKERSPAHPNQLPEVYLNRVISVCSNIGDLVADPFCGSGTTAVVANALGRRCVTGDISETAAKEAIVRIKKGAVRV